MSAPSIDPCEFVLNYKASELQVAAEFFTHWLPFLSHDLCGKCTQILQNRVRSLDSGVLQPTSNADDSENVESENLVRLSYTRQDSGSSCDELEANSPSCQTDCGHEYSEQAVDQRALQPFPDVETPGDWVDVADSDNGCHECTENSPDHWGDGAEKGQEHSVDYATSEKAQPLSDASTSHMSWADMAQEDELEEANRQSWADACDMATENLRVQQKTELSRDRREYIRFMNVRRKKDFILLERVKGKIVNILDGLELHAGVFSAVEQKRIVDYIYSLQEMGKKGQLKARTYSEPAKWMRGKGRVTIQFGCCYNYAVDKNGNPPGILREELVDPIPHLFKVIIRRLVRWHVLPPTCVPDSCIVNIYEPGDCIPPHIDNHDFVRPFCSVSFLSECNILFGSNLRIVGPGEFSGSTAIPLPVGSVLVLKGNGADVAKHCIPGVPAKRISITFRKMENTKLPFRFVPEPDLQCIQPLPYDSSKPTNKPASKAHQTYFNRHQVLEGGSEESELHGGQASRFVQPRFPRGRSRSSNRPRVRLNLPKN